MKKFCLIAVLVSVTAFAAITPIVNLYFTQAGVACDKATWKSELLKPGRIVNSTIVTLTDVDGSTLNYCVVAAFTGIDTRPSAINPADGQNYVLDKSGNLTTWLFTPHVWNLHVGGPPSRTYSYSGYDRNFSTSATCGAFATTTIATIRSKQPLPVQTKR